MHPESESNNEWENVGGPGTVEGFEGSVCSFVPDVEANPDANLVFGVPLAIWLVVFFVQRKFTVRSLFILTLCYAALLAVYRLQ
jgi:hypothetical protein